MSKRKADHIFSDIFIMAIALWQSIDSYSGAHWFQLYVWGIVLGLGFAILVKDWCEDEV